MAIDVNDPNTPTDTDPVGAPANGIQVHMRAVKLLLKQIRERYGFAPFPDIQSSWQKVSVTWRNLNTTAGGPTTLLRGLGITAVTRVAGDASAYDLTLSLPLVSTNLRSVSIGVYRTDGTVTGWWTGAVRTITSSTIRITLFNHNSGTSVQPSTGDTIFFSLEAAN